MCPVVPYVAGGPAEQPLITLLTFVAMATQWNLLAGFSGLTSFGQQAYLGLGAYALYLVAVHGVNPLPRPARACGSGGSGGWPTSWRRAARARWGR
jgi:branched-chain amino acid transport system permease protein